MSKKKKKDYQFHIRTQTLAGLVVGPNGQWMEPRSAGLTTESPQFKDVYAGTMGKAYKGTHKKTQKQKATPDA